MKNTSLFLSENKITSKFKLFCFPYAGGSASIYRSWQQYFGTEIEVIRVQLPGRGSRINEPLYTNLESLVGYLCDEIVEYLNPDDKFAFFGHSMGALVSFEVALKLRDKSIYPSHLFLSGRQPPHFLNKIKKSQLSEMEFKEMLISLNGIPSSLINNEEMMAIAIPILKADFKLCDDHDYFDATLQDIKFVILGGFNDPLVKQDSLLEWERYTTKEVKLLMFEGDHFYIHTSEKEITEEIRKIILNDFQTIKGGI